tara:strand:+ start:97 stop:333 length:237 start_codon:yes stop_codon:yes gene_type:complete
MAKTDTITKKKPAKKKAAVKAPKVVEKTTLLELLKKGWEYDKKILNSCWDFLKVGDVCSYVVGIMGLWLVYDAIISIF